MNEQGRVLGYRFSADHNDSYMLRDADFPRCPACGMKTDPLWIKPSFHLGRRKLDLSFTYDGYLIVSRPVMDIVQGTKSQVDFIPLPNDPEYFVVDAKETFVYATVAGETTREEWCG